MNKLQVFLLVLILVLMGSACSGETDKQEIPTQQPLKLLSVTTVPTTDVTPSPMLTITATYVPSSTPYPTATHSPALATAIDKGECIQSFSTFAYQAPLNIIRERKQPSVPWQVEATIPPHQIEGLFESYDSSFQIQFVRSINERQEIWILGKLWSTTYIDNKQLIIVYKADSQEWEFISADVGETGLIIGNLYVDSDGSIWGRTTWRRGYDYGNRTTFPVLSRFNETSQQFELAEGGLEIPLVREIVEDGKTFVVSDNTRIDLAKNDVFWIFTENGLYQYDPVSQITEKQINFPEHSVSYPTFAPDGSLYFIVDNSLADSFLGYFQLSDGELFEYIPETGEIITIDLPDEGWWYPSGMLFDHSGRLWLGAIGYRETDGTWHLIREHPEELFDLIENGGYSYIWGHPYIMLESSNGILWYAKFFDTSGHVDGIAWYNPEAGEGCQFTNIPAFIVEDSKQQLWLLADGALYKYPLNP